MADTIELGDITVEVVRKAIKNVHLRVYPPLGRVRLSAPRWMSLGEIRLFLVSRLDWIQKTRNKIGEQDWEGRLDDQDRDNLDVWGQRCLLKVVERAAAPVVWWEQGQLFLQIRPGSSPARKQAVLDGWYREQITAAVPPLVAKWEPLMGVTVSRFFVQRMKTRWGTCRPLLKIIRLNSDLAKKPPECLEYVVVHEMAHLLERGHNVRFHALMDRFIPRWKFCRELLNRRRVPPENGGSVAPYGA